MRFVGRAVLFLSVIFVSVIMFLRVGVEGGNAEETASLQIFPDSYRLQGDYMSGGFELRTFGNGYAIQIDLVMNEEPYNTASFEGLATIKGNKIVASGTDDDAEIVITFIDNKTAVIEANGTAAGYAGLNAGFDGQYTVSVQDQSVETENDEDYLANLANLNNLENLTESIEDFSQKLIAGKKHTFEDIATLTDEYGDEEESPSYMRAWKNKNYYVVREYKDETWEESYLIRFWTNDPSFDFGSRIKVGSTFAELSSFFGESLYNSNADEKPKEYSVLSDGTALSFEIERDIVKSITFMIEIGFSDKMIEHLGL
jgi:hypothetical protein